MNRLGTLLNHLSRRQQSAILPSSSCQRCTVLAIDDDPAILNSIRSLPQLEGFKVMTAISGVRGIQILQNKPNDVGVVLLDYTMSQLSGLQTLAYLRRLSPHIRVLGVTAFDPRIIDPIFRDGVDSCIQKPFTIQQLTDAIQTVMMTKETAH